MKSPFVEAFSCFLAKGFQEFGLKAHFISQRVEYPWACLHFRGRAGMEGKFTKI